MSKWTLSRTFAWRRAGAHSCSLSVWAKRSKQAFHICLTMSRVTPSACFMVDNCARGRDLSFSINDSSLEHPIAWSEASVLFFPAKVSLYNPGWSGTLYVEQVGLKPSCLYLLRADLRAFVTMLNPNVHPEPNPRRQKSLQASRKSITHES